MGSYGLPIGSGSERVASSALIAACANRTIGHGLIAASPGWKILGIVGN